jgi:protein-S-isoprenylcysteine O-methyltransferase Ste14
MTMLVLPTLLMLGVGVIHLLLLQWEAGREERYLLALHGEDYRVYRSRTGRFLPRSWSAYSPRD